MTRLDDFVTRFRRFVEDRLPWYDRDDERRKIAQTEAVRQRSIRTRIRAEAILADDRLRRY